MHWFRGPQPQAACCGCGGAQPRLAPCPRPCAAPLQAPCPAQPLHHLHRPPTLARASSMARCVALLISAAILTDAILEASLCRYSSVSAGTRKDEEERGGGKYLRAQQSGVRRVHASVPAGRQAQGRQSTAGGRQSRAQFGVRCVWCERVRGSLCAGMPLGSKTPPTRQELGDLLVALARAGGRGRRLRAQHVLVRLEVVGLRWGQRHEGGRCGEVVFMLWSAGCDARPSLTGPVAGTRVPVPQSAHTGRTPATAVTKPPTLSASRRMARSSSFALLRSRARRSCTRSTPGARTGSGRGRLMGVRGRSGLRPMAPTDSKPARQPPATTQRPAAQRTAVAQRARVAGRAGALHQVLLAVRGRLLGALRRHLRLLRNLLRQWWAVWWWSRRGGGEEGQAGRHSTEQLRSGALGATAGPWRRSPAASSWRPHLPAARFRCAACGAGAGCACTLDPASARVAGWQHGSMAEIRSGGRRVRRPAGRQAGAGAVCCQQGCRLARQSAGVPARQPPTAQPPPTCSSSSASCSTSARSRFCCSDSLRRSRSSCARPMGICWERYRKPGVASASGARAALAAASTCARRAASRRSSCLWYSSCGGGEAEAQRRLTCGLGRRRGFACQACQGCQGGSGTSPGSPDRPDNCAPLLPPPPHLQQALHVVAQLLSAQEPGLHRRRGEVAALGGLGQREDGALPLVARALLLGRATRLRLLLRRHARRQRHHTGVPAWHGAARVGGCRCCKRPQRRRACHGWRPRCSGRRPGWLHYRRRRCWHRLPLLLLRAGCRLGLP